MESFFCTQIGSFSLKEDEDVIDVSDINKLLPLSEGIIDRFEIECGKKRRQATPQWYSPGRCGEVSSVEVIVVNNLFEVVDHARVVEVLSDLL